MPLAPQEALDYLEKNPDAKDDFRKTFGYVPAPKEALNYLYNNPDAKEEFIKTFGAEAIPESFNLVESGQKSTALGTAGRALGENAVPAAAGLGGFAAGAAAGAPIAPFFGPAAPAVPLVTGVLGAFGASTAVATGQQKLLEAFPEAAKALGLDPARREADALTNPTANVAGAVAAQGLTLRPSVGSLKQVLGGAAIGGGVSAGTQYAETGEIDPTQLALEAAGGAIFNKSYGVGSKIENVGTRVGERVGEKIGSILPKPKARSEYVTREPINTEIDDSDLLGDPIPAEQQPVANAPVDAVSSLKERIAKESNPTVKKILEKSLKDRETLRKLEGDLNAVEERIAEFGDDPQFTAEINSLKSERNKMLKQLEKIKTGAAKAAEGSKEPQKDNTVEFEPETPLDKVEGYKEQYDENGELITGRKEPEPPQPERDTGNQVEFINYDRTSPEADAQAVAESNKQRAIEGAIEKPVVTEPTQQASAPPPTTPTPLEPATSKLGAPLKEALESSPESARKIELRTRGEEAAQSEAEIKARQEEEAFRSQEEGDNARTFEPEAPTPLEHVENLLREADAFDHVGRATKLLNNKLETDPIVQKALSDLVSGPKAANDLNFDVKKLKGNKAAEKLINAVRKRRLEKANAPKAPEPVGKRTPTDLEKAVADRKAKARDQNASEKKKKEPRVIRKSKSDDSDIVSNQNDEGSEVTRSAQIPHRDDGIKRDALPREDVQKIVDEVVGKWKSKPRVKIVDKPEDIGKTNPEGGYLLGLFRKRKGEDGNSTETLYLFREQLFDHSDVRSIILHEGVAHYGLRGAFGNRLNDVLARVAKSRPDLVSAKLRDYGLGGEGTQARTESVLTAAEEVLADFAQNDRRNNLLQQAAAVIRNFLRTKLPSVFGKINLTDNEIINEIISPARRFVEKGQRADLKKVEKHLSKDATLAEVDAIISKFHDQINEINYGSKYKDTLPQKDILGTFAAEAVNIDQGKAFKLKTFWTSVADRFRSSPGLKKLGNATIDWVDKTADLKGKFNAQLYDSAKDINKLSKEKKIEVDKNTARYFELLHKSNYEENGAKFKEELAAHVKGLSPVEKAWIRSNRNAIKVYAEEASASGLTILDPKTGTRRPFDPIKDYFPLAIKQDIRRALNEPHKYPDEYFKAKQLLVESGRAKSLAEAQKYLESFQQRLIDTGNDTRRLATDFFGNIELARETPLPSEFYDFSSETLFRYRDRGAERIAQISAFGQRYKGHPDLFEQALEIKGIDKKTQSYIKAVAERIYGTAPQSTFDRVLSVFSTFASGAHLGNPGSALNNLTGIALTGGTFGPKASAKAIKDLADLAKDPIIREKLSKDLRRKGIIVDDFTNQLSDASANATIYNDFLDKAQKGVNEFTRFTLKYGGHDLSEKLNRTYTYLTAKHVLLDGLENIRKEPFSQDSKLFRELLKDQNVNIRRLLNESTIENGPTPETDKFYRRIVNKIQGSYNLDAIPLWLDSSFGRVFFKYYKYTTQTTRLYLDEIIKPLARGDLKTWSRNVAGKFLSYHAAVLGAAYAIGNAREELFNYAFGAPDIDEIATTLEKSPDYAAKISVLYLTLQQSMQITGAAGVIGQASEFIRAFSSGYEDPTEFTKLKNPVQPAAIGPISATVDLVNRIIQTKGNITASDYDDILERTFSQYRITKRAAGTLAQALPDKVNETVKDISGGVVDPLYIGEVQDARLAKSYTQKWLKEYAREKKIETDQNVSAGIGQLFNVTGLPDIKRTANTSYNSRIRAALSIGDPDTALEILKESLGAKGEDADSIAEAKRSLQASINNNDPLSLRGVPKDSKLEEDFYQWMTQRVSKESIEEIRKNVSTYREAARKFNEMTETKFFKEPVEGALEKAINKKKLKNQVSYEKTKDLSGK